jgi:hypothetical protein
MKTLIAIAGAIAAWSAPAAAEPGEPTEIAYETGPCFGRCPVYRVTVRSDGRGTFEGRRDTAVTGTRSFRITPARYRAYARHLAPLRPRRGTERYSGERCRVTATDMPSAEVSWTGRGGASQQLYFYYGCDMGRNRAIADRLTSAPNLLPIRQFIGAR